MGGTTGATQTTGTTGTTGQTQQQTTDQDYKLQSWQESLPANAKESYLSLVPQLTDKYFGSQVEGKGGLTDAETNYYTDQMKTGLAETAAGSKKSFSESLARLGINPSSGAAVEGLSNIGRSQVQGEAAGYSDIMGKDITQKQTNLTNLLTTLGMPGGSTVTGTSGTGTGTSTGTSATDSSTAQKQAGGS